MFGSLVFILKRDMQFLKVQLFYLFLFFYYYYFFFFEVGMYFYTINKNKLMKRKLPKRMLRDFSMLFPSNKLKKRKKKKKKTHTHKNKKKEKFKNKIK